MLKTLQTQQPWNPQAAESHVEHPQTPTFRSDDRQADTGDFLVVSPYTSLPHLLDLRTLETSQLLLAKALTILSTVQEDYATAPYTDSFNWAIVFTRLKALTQQIGYQWQNQHFYIVVFRSQVPPTTNRVELGGLDDRSHAEATKSGGLLKYWFGIPDANGRNLATCAFDYPLFLSFSLLSLTSKRLLYFLSKATDYSFQGIWRQQSDARPASVGPGHKAAMRATVSMYSEWKIERLKLEIGEGVNEWSIVPWKD